MKLTLIESFLQLLDQVSRQPEEGDFSDAQEYYNREKNRYPDKLPCMLAQHAWYNSRKLQDFLFHLLDNMSRARLRPTAEEGSEYINASFVDVGLNSHCYLQFIFFLQQYTTELEK